MSANNPIPSPPIGSGGTPLYNVVTVAVNTILTSANDVVLVDATTGSKTITLPPAASATGKLFDIKKIDSSSNSVVVDANGAETIDGTLTKSTIYQYTSFSVFCDGLNWHIL